MLILSFEEKHIIGKALKFAKNSIDNDLGHLEYINDIEEDLKKQNLLFSRTQIDVIVFYLDILILEIKYDIAKVIALQQKLNSLSNLP